MKKIFLFNLLLIICVRLSAQQIIDLLDYMDSQFPIDNSVKYLFSKNILNKKGVRVSFDNDLIYYCYLNQENKTDSIIVYSSNELMKKVIFLYNNGFNFNNNWDWGCQRFFPSMAYRTGNWWFRW